MTVLSAEMTRRQYLAATGALLATAGVVPAQAAALAPIRQGFQTNIWGMPTYYVMRSGLLEKRGIKFEEFAVPAGNLTMQQMVARQVDLGTYAGPSLIIGHARGGMVGIAVIEHVGKSIQVMARRELGISKIEQLRGKKVAIQVGSSVANIFVDQIAPGAGLRKGDWQEVRMNAPQFPCLRACCKPLSSQASPSAPSSDAGVRNVDAARTQKPASDHRTHLETSMSAATESIEFNFKLIGHHELDGFGGIGEGMSIQIAPGRAAHPLAGARERAEELHRRRRVRSAQAEDRRARPTLPHNKVRSNSLELVGDIMAVAYQTEQPGLKPAGFELFDISKPGEAAS